MGPASARERSLDGTLQLLRVGFDGRFETRNAPAALDQVFVKIPLRRTAGCRDQLRIERIGAQRLVICGLAEHRESDAEVLFAEPGDVAVGARLLVAEV